MSPQEPAESAAAAEDATYLAHLGERVTIALKIDCAKQTLTGTQANFGMRGFIVF